MAVNQNWGRFCTLTVANTQVAGNNNLSNFVARISENDVPAEVVSSTDSNRPRSDGGDIRFTSDSAGSNELAFEIVSYNQSTPSGTIEVYVKIPTLQYNVDTTIYMWWKNASATGYAVTATYGRNAVWSDYMVVLHNPDDLVDSTGNYTVSEQAAGSVTTDFWGNSNKARNFLGNDEVYVDLNTGDPALDGTSGTLQCFAQKGATEGAAVLVLSETGPEWVAIASNLDTGFTEWYLSYYTTSESDYYITASNSQWDLLHYTYSSGPSAGTLYIDGTGSAGTLYSTSNPIGAGSSVDRLTIGGHSNFISTADSPGYIHEVRWRKSTLSGDWITTENNNFADTGAFWTAGTATNNISFPTDWDRKCTLTVANAKVSGSTNLSNFPALITHNDLPNEVLDSDDTNGPKSDGSDIRFTSDANGTTELAFEIVHFTRNANPALATVEIYVKIPTLQYNTDTTIYMWWGQASAGAYNATDTYGRNAVWSDFEFVSHNGGRNDSTGNYTPSEDGTVSTATNHLGVSGKAASFDTGVAEGFSTSLDAAFDLGTNNCTITFWANKNNVSGMNGRAIHLTTASPNEAIQMIANSSEGANWVANASGATSTSGYYQTASNSAWHYIRGEFASGTEPSHSGVRVDGGSLGTSVTSSSWGIGSILDEITIGYRNDSNTAADYEGLLSEIRIHFGTTPSADQYITEYNNQVDDGTFWTAGTPGPAHTVLKSASDTLSPYFSGESASVIGSLTISTYPASFDHNQTGLTITGAGFGASQGTGKVEISDNPVYASGTKTAQTVTAWSDTSITFTGNLSTRIADHYYLWVSTNSNTQTSVYPVTVYREDEWNLSDSTNFTDGASANARLTAPSGYTTANFVTGRMFDTTNPGVTAINMGRDDYTEVEFSIIAAATTPDDQQYEFRIVVYDENDASYTYTSDLDIYSVTPRYTIQSTIPKSGSDSITIKIDPETSSNALSSSRSDSLLLALAEVSSFPTITMARSDSLLVRLDEAYNILVSLARSDDIKPRLEEAYNILVSLARSDDIKPRLDDASSLFKFVQIAVSEFIRPRIDEGAISIAVLLHVALWDFLQWDFVDVDYTYAQVESLREDNNVNALFRYPDQMDRYGVVIGDFDTFAANSFGFDITYANAVNAITQVFPNDTLSPKIVEGAVNLLNMFEKTDNISPQITESLINQLRSSRADDLTLSIAELAYNLVRSSVSDTLLPQILESFSIIVSLSRTDDLNVLVNELTAIFVTLNRNDDILPLFIETMGILSSLSRTEDIKPRIDDASDILASLSRTDNLPVTVDGVVSLFVALSRQDTLSPQLIDNLGTILSYLSRSDDLLPRIDETFQIFGTVSASDDILLTVTGASQIVVALLLNDDIKATIDDVLDILSFIVNHYRWRFDDGSETLATWAQTQDSNVEVDLNTNIRLRIQVDTYGDTGVTQFVLQYRKVGDPDWEWRDVPL